MGEPGRRWAVLRAVLAAVLLAVLNLCLLPFVLYFHTGGHGPPFGPGMRELLIALVVGGGLAAGVGWAILVGRLERKPYTAAMKFAFATVATQAVAVLATLPLVVGWLTLLSARNWHELLGIAFFANAAAGLPLGLVLAAVERIAARPAQPTERPTEDLPAAGAPVRPWPFVLLVVLACFAATAVSRSPTFLLGSLVLVVIWLAVVVWHAIHSIRRTGKVTGSVFLWGALLAQVEAALATLAFGRLGAGQNPDDLIILICAVICLGGGLVFGLLAWGAGVLAQPPRGFQHSEPRHWSTTRTAWLLSILLVVSTGVGIASTWNRLFDHGVPVPPPPRKGVDLTKVPEGTLVYKLIARDARCFALHPPAKKLLENELLVPVDTNVIFEFNDVDRAYKMSIPAFRVERELLPDRRQRTWFRATKIGEYKLYLRPLRSDPSGQGTATVRVLTRQDYDQRFR